MTVRPEAVQEVALDPLDTTLVEGLECALGEAEGKTTQATNDQGDDGLDDAEIPQLMENLDLIRILTAELRELSVDVPNSTEEVHNSDLVGFGLGWRWGLLRFRFGRL